MSRILALTHAPLGHCRLLGRFLQLPSANTLAAMGISRGNVQAGQVLLFGCSEWRNFCAICMHPFFHLGVPAVDVMTHYWIRRANYLMCYAAFDEGEVGGGEGGLILALGYDHSLWGRTIYENWPIKAKRYSHTTDREVLAD